MPVTNDLVCMLAGTSAFHVCTYTHTCNVAATCGLFTISCFMLQQLMAYVEKQRRLETTLHFKLAIVPGEISTTTTDQRH
jgi:hypothetical protein